MLRLALDVHSKGLNVYTHVFAYYFNCMFLNSMQSRKHCERTIS